MCMVDLDLPGAFGPALLNESQSKLARQDLSFIRQDTGKGLETGRPKWELGDSRDEEEIR